jgi:hypothetical protein
MVDRKWTTKYKILMTSSKIPGHLRLHRVTRWHPRSAPCMTMMCFLSIQFPPPTTSSLFKVLMVEVPHIAWCFQAGLMGLTRKEMHLFQPWKTLTRSMQLLARDTSTPPLQVVPPTIPSRASTRSKSKNAPQSSLGPIVPFVANLRGQALPRKSTTSMGPRRPMLSRDVEGAPTNNTDNGNEHLPPIRALRRARRPREDGLRRDVMKQTKRIKSTIGPTQDKTKTKKLIEFGCAGCDSDDSDAELSGENDDTSHAEAPSDSTYCEGD